MNPTEKTCDMCGTKCGEDESLCSECECCVYCGSKEIETHCDGCAEAGDGGAMCRDCWREKGHEHDDVPYCGGCWEELLVEKNGR